jgi:L-ribulose-5-phosphate 4-epimerase
MLKIPKSCQQSGGNKLEFADIRQQVLDTVKKMCVADLIRMSAGNVSARVQSDYLAITPTSLSYDIMKPEDIVIVDLDGKVVEGKLRPTSEIALHTAIMRSRPGVNAVVHTHSVYSMSFAIANRSIPMVCTEGAFVGGEVPVARYATPGTPDVAESALEALNANPEVCAALLRNHGLVAIGSSLTGAWETAYKVEVEAQAYYQALQLGHPTPITLEQYNEIKAVYFSH